MHILYCKVAQQTKFVISEAGRFLFFLQSDSLHGGVSLLQRHFLRRLRLSERGEARLELHGEHRGCSPGEFAEGLEATLGVWSGQGQGPG